jgi:hypothetical protein
MNNEFFKEQLRIAEVKVNEETKAKAAALESKTNVLKEFSKPILDFLFYLNENVSFNKNTPYNSDKTLLSTLTTQTREKLEGQAKDMWIKIHIVTMISKYSSFDYITIHIDDNYNCSINYDNNTTQKRHTFTDVQSFIEDFSIIVAKNKD